MFCVLEILIDTGVSIPRVDYVDSRRRRRLTYVTSCIQCGSNDNLAYRVLEYTEYELTLEKNLYHRHLIHIILTV